MYSMVQKFSVEKLSAKLKTFGLFSISTFLNVLKNFRSFLRSTPEVKNFRPFLVEVQTLDGNSKVKNLNEFRNLSRYSILKISLLIVEVDKVLSSQIGLCG